ncbi:MAG: phage terminase large subunit [Chitinophagia bacterium]
MKTATVEASLFKLLPSEMQTAMVQSGALPVNDIFLPLWDNRNKINLLYGSYGSGKSIFIVDRFITHAIEDKYFRCYFGRKIFDSVRGSVFKTITDRIKERNLAHLFNFSDAPNGSMNIVCKENGNEFIPFGANNPDSLKSIKDPSHFFCEEFDQFSLLDFRFIYTRLRTEKAVTQFYGSFNTDRLFKGHWIRRTFFEGDFENKCFKLLSTYKDNYFINQEDYLEKLKIASGGSASVLAAIAAGVMGVIRTGSEFWKFFDEEKHVKPVVFDRSSTVHVSLDENVNPYVTQTIWQINSSEKHIKQVHEICSKSPNNNAPKAAKQFIEYLQSLNYSNVVYVYGDPSGAKRSTIDENNASFFDKYIAELKAAGYSVINRVGRSAPAIALSAAFINAIYEHNQDGWTITIADHCYSSIEDYIVVKEDEEGKMQKLKVKDKETGVTYEQHGHISDSKRYFIITVLKEAFENYRSRSKRSRPRRVN